MTGYLTVMRQRLEDRFNSLDDIHPNMLAFHGLADLIRWIDQNPEAGPEQYSHQVKLVQGQAGVVPWKFILEESKYGVVQPGGGSQCRECPAWVNWVLTTRTAKGGGNLMPINQDDTSHFASCPGAAKRRRKK